MSAEVGKTEIIETVMVSKFDGDAEDGVLTERLHLTQGVIVKQEFFADGELTHTLTKDFQIE